MPKRPSPDPEKGDIQAPFATLFPAMEMARQRDLISCGPTCLHAVYRHFGDDMGLDALVREVRSLEGGGTLAVLLGCHALERGYQALLYSYNLRVFDPTWFPLPRKTFRQRLRQSILSMEGKRRRIAAEAYERFLALGGEVRMEDLSGTLIRGYLDRGLPILTGLSATYLYQAPREVGIRDDDIRGDPQGHFVVLAGHEAESDQVLVADPLGGTVWVTNTFYPVRMERLITAILLGVLTNDANLLILEPKE